MEDGKVMQTKGVVPVFDNVKYNTIYQNHDNGVWTPISNPTEPVMQYVGYGTPLTADQMNKLLKAEKKDN